MLCNSPSFALTVRYIRKVREKTPFAYVSICHVDLSISGDSTEYQDRTKVVIPSRLKWESAAQPIETKDPQPQMHMLKAVLNRPWLCVS